MVWGNKKGTAVKLSLSRELKSGRFNLADNQGALVVGMLAARFNPLRDLRQATAYATPHGIAWG